VSRTCIIVNPAAGRGQARKRLPQIRESFARAGITDVRETAAAGDEERVTRAALDAGCSTIAVVGGDGTCARVASTIIETGADCAVAVLPGGTGNDFAKTLGVFDYEPDQIAALCAHGARTRIDMGLAGQRYFLNSCGFGFDASVLEASNRVRFIKGNAVYIYSALGQLFTYPGVDVSVSGVPGVTRGRMLMITVSIGRFLGGAFRIAPKASVIDGKLDVCLFRDSNVIERVKLFAGALRGTHIGMPSVTAAAVEKVALTFPNKPLMEVDGELRRADSNIVELKCVPGALSVVAAPGAFD
jgi:diacylglycerol kinase (ATP)